MGAYQLTTVNYLPTCTCTHTHTHTCTHTHTHAHTHTYMYMPHLQLLDEVRAVGSQKKGTALAGNTVADLVILLRDLPSGEGRMRSELF